MKFTKLPLPEAWQQAFAVHARVTKPSVHQQQEIIVELMLFRVDEGDAARASPLSLAAIAELDRLLAASQTSHFNSRPSADIAENFAVAANVVTTSNGFSLANRDTTFRCVTTVRRGFPLDAECFSFDFLKFEDHVGGNYDGDEAEEVLETMKHGLVEREKALAVGLGALEAAGYFEPNEEVFVHRVDDRQDSHGFINMPWGVWVGQTHAFAAIRAGTWY